MFQIGDSLREARTRRGFTAADVQKAIRIRERYLTALEEERWDMLPGEAYTKGFLRTYSEYLGLDGQLYVDEYNTRVARHLEDGPPLVPHPADARAMRRGPVVLLAVIAVIAAAVGGLAAWRLGGSTHTAKHSQAPSTGESAAVTTPTAPSHPKQKPVLSTRPVFTSISATRGRCWILVRSGGPSGTVLFEGTLEQGQAKRFRVTSRLWVRMGRPDMVDITLAGKPVGGTLPATPSNIVLTRAEALRQ